VLVKCATNDSNIIRVQISERAPNIYMTCEQFKKQFGLSFDCCTSCHEDDDMGYGNDLWFETLDLMEWHICCAAARAYDKKVGEDLKEANAKQNL